MTVTADAKRRVILRDAKPGDCFEVKVSGDRILLTRMKPAEPKRPKVRLVRDPEKGYLVAVLERVVTQEEVRKFMDEFP